MRIFKAFSLVKKKKNTRTASKVGQLVNDGIQRKIIVIVAMMLIGNEILLIIADVDTFLASAPSFQNELARLELLLNVSGMLLSSFFSFLFYFSPFFFFFVCGVVMYSCGVVGYWRKAQAMRVISDVRY